MELDKEDIERFIPDETLEKIPEGYEEEVYGAVESGRKPAGTLGAIFHYKMDMTQKEAAEEAGVSEVTVRNTGESLGYTEDDAAEIEGYKALVPDKFRPLIDLHKDRGGKAKTLTAGIYASITDNNPGDVAEAFGASPDHVIKNARKTETYLDAEKITDGKYLADIYSSEKPEELARAIQTLSGNFKDKLAESEYPMKTAKSIEFFLNDEGFGKETTFVPEREVRSLIYGDDGLGAEKTAEILSERIPEDYSEGLFDLTTSGNDPRIVSAVILENETKMEDKEIQRTTGAGTFEIERNRERIEELLNN